jgi:hypothetical protein
VGADDRLMRTFINADPLGDHFWTLGFALTWLSAGENQRKSSRVSRCSGFETSTDSEARPAGCFFAANNGDNGGVRGCRRTPSL